MTRRARLLAVLLVGLLAAAACAGPGSRSDGPRPGPPPPTRPLLTVAHWQQVFDDDAAAAEPRTRALSRSSDSAELYTLAYSIDELVAMYEATGEARYVDRALEYVENVMATARISSTLPGSSFRDGYLGWAAAQQAGDEVALYESYGWRYVARLLRVLHDGPLAADPAYRPRYERALAFTETHVFDKWMARGPDDHVYRSRTHMAAHWAYIALELSRITEDPVRRERASAVVTAVDRALPNQPSSLHGQLRPNEDDPAAWWWSDVWGETEGPAQDVSHGNNVVSYVVEAHDLGSGWSDDDVARFGRTLTSFVLGAPDDHPELVDGTGRGNGWIADGFVKLGRYDPAVQALLETHDVQNTQYVAAMALNARRLGAVGAP